MTVIQLKLKYLLHDMLKTVTILIENGVVVASVLGDYDFSSVDAKYDLVDYGIAMPGFIDMHVHLRGLELSYKEDEESGTRASVHGGFTLVLDMPNTIPPINTVEALNRKVEQLKSRSYTDYGLYIGLGDLEQFKSMVLRSEVVGVKIYPHDMKKPLLRYLELFPKNKLVVVHAEDIHMLKESCGEGYRWICRPVEAELNAIASFVNMSRELGFKLHITHITSYRGCVLAKTMSSSTTLDTCPHYLLLDNDIEKRFGCLAKVDPPLRPRYIVEELRYAFRAGLIDAVVSDHAPHSIDEKKLSFSDCPSGIGGIELVFSLLNSFSESLRISLSDIARFLSLNPTKILGLSSWGCIEPGCIASYTVVDPKKEFELKIDFFETKARESIIYTYLFKKLRGLVTATIVRGKPVFLRDGIYGKQFEKPYPEAVSIGHLRFLDRYWSRRGDSNPRPPGD